MPVLLIYLSKQSQPNLTNTRKLVTIIHFTNKPAFNAMNQMKRKIRYYLLYLHRYSQVLISLCSK